MDELIQKIRNQSRPNILFQATILFCAVCIAFLLRYYFQAFSQPYMKNEMLDLSKGWQYRVNGGESQELENLGTGPKLAGGETITLYRTLTEEMKEAAILIRANHQAVTVLLDGVLLYTDGEPDPEENPGMALHFILLPPDYLDQTLTVELTSPYALYAGRTSPIFMGTIPTLEAFALSRSMRSVILMAMCLLLGIFTLTLTFVRALLGYREPQNLVIGIFAVIWALYYVCTEYIVFQFFTPIQMSRFSLGLYFTFQVPLVLYFYFSFENYRRQLLPAVILHTGFAVSAFLLQLLGMVELPRLINVNNVLLVGLAYTILLAILEAFKKNRLMLLAVPFLLVAYGSMLYNFIVFYTRQGVVPYSYRDTYFLLLLFVLVYNVQQYFSQYYRKEKESDVLLLQNRLAKESYEQIKTHLQAVGGLKHEMKNHIAALQIYLDDGRYREARSYLEQYGEQTGTVTEAVHHEHLLINAAAGNLLARAQEQGIRVELNLKGSPVRISDPDLYSLLSNILDNALEACAAVSGRRDRFIRLTISRREPYLHISCVNSRAGQLVLEDGEIRTSKQESGHGFGLWTVDRIAESYDGLVDTEYDETTFTITVALKDGIN